MRAFVTGASGFIGHHLVSALLKKGWQVRVLVHRTLVSADGPLESVHGDLSDAALLKRSFKGVDALFHLASALGFSLIDERTFFNINAAGTETLLAAARENRIKRIIHCSSAGVLGHVAAGDVADESFPLNPQDAYDRSKLEGERIALRFAAEGSAVTVVRPGWVYGPGDTRTLKLIRAVARGRFLMVTAGKALQTPIFVDDLVAGFFRVLELGRRGEVYHLAGPEVLTVKEMVTTIARATGRRLPPFHLPLAPTRAAAAVMGQAFRLMKREAPLSPSRLAFFIHPKPLAIDKAKKELGYAPRVRFEEGMARTVSWYRQQGWL